MNDSLFSRYDRVSNSHPETTQRRSWGIPACARTTALALTLAFLPAMLSAQPAPITGTTIKSTDSSASSLCVGCPTTSAVPAANSGAKIQTITLPTAAAPSVTTEKLYNISGGLYWNGTLLATGSSVSGTLNTIGRFTGAAAVGDSIITQNAGATTITVAGSLNVTGVVTATTQFAGSGAALTSIPTSAVSSGNFVATVASGTGLTSSVTSGNAAATTISLNNTAVTPAAYGAGVPVSFTVDQQGRITTAASTALSFAVGGTLGSWDTSTLVPVRVGIAAVYAGHAGAINAYFGTNFAYNGGYKYLTTEAAHKLQVDATGFSFATAPSGTAGNAITFTTGLVVQSTGLSVGGANLTDAVATPTIASGCGTGATIAGKASFFTVTAGTGSPTNCQVNFNQTFANPPACSANRSAGSAGTASVSVSTTTTVVAFDTTALISTEKLHAICRGY